MRRFAWMFLAVAALSMPVRAWAEEPSLEDIAAKQDRILQILDEIKSELQVIKVRATNG